jgi:DNA-directed RNA polymerase subunit alpha
VTLQIKVNRKGAVTAADIQADANIKIVNPDQLICTLDRKQTFEAEIEIKTGRGYYPGERTRRKSRPSASFRSIRSSLPSASSVCRRNTRVGQITDYDKLILEIWTDGRITPDDALKQSASILKHHLDVFDRVSPEAYEFESVSSPRSARSRTSSASSSTCRSTRSSCRSARRTA